MALTFENIAGFSDVPNDVLVHDLPALGIYLSEIAENAQFGMVRPEIFMGLYHHGDTVIQPTSPVDRYNYARNELRYFYTIRSTANPVTFWMTGPDCLWYMNYKVDQDTGKVEINEWYRRSGSHLNAQTSNDGTLLVMTLAQRQRASIIATDVVFHGDMTADIAVDAPLKQALAQGLNEGAKFAALNTEAIYMGEFNHGNTIPQAVSPEDGHTYTYAETIFLPMWRFTNGSTVLTQPDIAWGQLERLQLSVNGSHQLQLTQIYRINELLAVTEHSGRAAVIALCSRDLGGATFGAVQDDFTEISPDFFFPGSTLRASTLEILNANIMEASLSPEVFAETDYVNGNTVPRPTSPVDGYQYARVEMHYFWYWKTTGPESAIRLPVFGGHVDDDGSVHTNTWRLPPGGPSVQYHDGTLRVTVVGVRQRQNPILTDIGDENAPGDVGSIAVDLNDIQVNGV